MDHNAHVAGAGTVEDCPACQSIAVEPGWYRALRDERVRHRRADRVAIPDAGVPDFEIVVTESHERGVSIPDLETST